ncbi:MAG TPA: potassium-transporting ATPase subunit C [Tepidisphaeraceae bacterium]|jgi:K+-transporting ATPase ATPase C chain
MNRKDGTLNLHDDYGHPDSQPEPVGMLHHFKTSVVATIVLAVIVCGLYPILVWGLAQLFFHDKANGSLIADKDGNVIGSRLLGQPFSAAKYFHPRPSAAGSGYDPTASAGSNLGPMSKKLLNGTTKPTTQPNPRGGDPIPGPDAVDYDGVKLRIVNYCDENAIPYDLVQQKKDENGKALESESKVVPQKTFKTDKGEYDQARIVNAFNDDSNTLIIKPSRPIPADAVTASGSGLDPHISVENARLQAKRVADARKVGVDVVEKLIADNTDGASLGILGEPGVNVLKLNLALDAKTRADR